VVQTFFFLRDQCLVGLLERIARHCSMQSCLGCNLQFVPEEALTSVLRASLQENHLQLSFSNEELTLRGTGLLATIVSGSQQRCACEGAGHCLGIAPEKNQATHKEAHRGANHDLDSVSVTCLHSRRRGARCIQTQAAALCVRPARKRKQQQNAGQTQPHDDSAH
jgi:hypothetical protein